MTIWCGNKIFGPYFFEDPETEHPQAINPFGKNSVFGRLLRYNPRQAPTVYRLIDAVLIRKFFHDPFLF